VPTALDLFSAGAAQAASASLSRHAGDGPLPSPSATIGLFSSTVYDFYVLYVSSFLLKSNEKGGNTYWTATTTSRW
jgi:hypothetical protein